ncbi:hypothetical protein NLM16_28200 [Bradyrhizobium brasilense]|uniref:hypothetical protein n=1 Tax=Bradyrhizobium brasilense TaxID=1419277 RepID=UPI0028777AF6|nr:hypothetical protein [Bradyrhizobium brasilense]MCP3417994.1 hypothetical protein [Bradyrhizobium brasilense]
MHQHQGDRALGQQPDLARTAVSVADTGPLQQRAEMGFEQGLVPARNCACGMAREIGQLDDQPGESRAGPSRPVRPDRQVAEQTVDDRRRRAGQLSPNVANAAKASSF